jgi:hypothetical protein
VISHI